MEGQWILPGSGKALGLTWLGEVVFSLLAAGVFLGMTVVSTVLCLITIL